MHCICLQKCSIGHELIFYSKDDMKERLDTKTGFPCNNGPKI